MNDWRLYLAVVSIISLNFSTVAFGQTPMKSLAEAVEDNSGVQAYAYMGRRCTALYLAMHARFKASGRSDSDDIIKDLWDKYMAWGELALMLTMQEPERQNTFEFYQASVLRVSKGYGEMWDRNFDLTGSAFGDMTIQDSDYCNSVLTLIQQQMGK